MKIIRFFLLFFLVTFFAKAQGTNIGAWRSHLSYRVPNGVVADGNMLYITTPTGFYTYNTLTHDIKTYSKIDGMADVQTLAIAYDATTETAVLAYLNGDIDLFQNDQFYNIPYLKLKNISGDKTITELYTHNGFAYVTSGIGEIVINLTKKEVKETYIFNDGINFIPIKSFAIKGNQYFAATPNGLYTANSQSGNLLSFANWQRISNQKLFHLSLVDGVLFASNMDSLFMLTSTNNLKLLLKRDSTIVKLDAGAKTLYVSVFYNKDVQFGMLMRYDTAGNFIDSTRVGHPLQTAELPNQDYWLADAFIGMKDNNYNTITPSGPYGIAAYDIAAHNKEVWIAHGAMTEDYKQFYSRDGVSQFYTENWKYYGPRQSSWMSDSVTDIMSLAQNPSNGNRYFGTYSCGLIELQPNGNQKIYKQGYIDSSVVQHQYYGSSSLAYDSKGTLWMTQSGAARNLGAMDKYGNWYHFYSPSSLEKEATGLIIDDNDLKWYIIPAKGIVVYDDNNTLNNQADDQKRSLGYGAGLGNLPSDNVFCLAKDKEGSIWIGTENGIGIINCPSQVISGGCEAERRVVQYDQFAGYLFQNEKVKSIAVDGGNRKWIGTVNGVWLISPDASKIIAHFTVNNSPLPSNHIYKIAIDGITGDVYIGTELGMVCYKSTATEGAAADNRITTFPNPVPAGFTGTISFTGLVANSDVRITDITGKLVYKTTANGGEAVWNGLDYLGHRPQTGVYLVFITDKTGANTTVSKFLYNH